ncbi:MAG: TetR/AcrR family transcriptional regulator [Hyphomicrobiaceae bacterium]|nr:TetR/AcrR family transcriptional regulator [Hyphomicrobiaceae bacterium]
MATAPRRHYGGHSAEERRLARRERLIEAAVRVYGKVGYRDATVKAVCEAAELTERYFYESFATSEELLIAALNTVSRRLIDCLNRIGAEHPGAADERCHAVLRAYFRALKDDPVGARLFVLEIARVGPAVDEAGAALLGEFGELLSRTLAPDAGARPRRDQLVRAGVVGAVLEIAKVWIRSGYAKSTDAVATDALKICRVLAH